jgi:hypothetical protein
MKKIVRLTESDLTKLVKYIIIEAQEQEAVLIDKVDKMLDSVPEVKTDDEVDPPIWDKIKEMIEDAGHDLEKFFKKLRRNSKKAIKRLKRKRIFPKKRRIVKPKRPGDLNPWE